MWIHVLDFRPITGSNKLEKMSWREDHRKMSTTKLTKAPGRFIINPSSLLFTFTQMQVSPLHQIPERICQYRWLCTSLLWSFVSFSSATSIHGCRMSLKWKPPFHCASKFVHRGLHFWDTFCFFFVFLKYSSMDFESWGKSIHCNKFALPPPNNHLKFKTVYKRHHRFTACWN